MWQSGKVAMWQNWENLSFSPDALLSQKVQSERLNDTFEWAKRIVLFFKENAPVVGRNDSNRQLWQFRKMLTPFDIILPKQRK